MAENTTDANLTYFGKSDRLTVGDLRTFVRQLETADDDEEVSVELECGTDHGLILSATSSVIDGAGVNQWHVTTQE